MKAIRLFMMLVLFSCVFGAVDALAGNVYGTSAVIYDYANNRTRGYSRTQVDYDTAEYYTAYVCGELYKDGVYQVRACQSGMITATIYTQYTGTSVTGSVLSDHYVDMKYFEDEQSSYVDYSGYRFSPGNSYPGDWFFYPADIFGYFNPVSIHLGSTTAVAPFITLNAFGSWDPDTIGNTASSDISISVSASSGLPSGTQVTLNFGSSVSGGTVNFSIAPKPNTSQFTFSIASGEQKEITPRYTVNSFTSAPNVQAQCSVSVNPGPPTVTVVPAMPQTSTSVLRIR